MLYIKLSIGSPAPNFELPDQDGHTQKLSAYRGQWVLLYFYPKDFTPGCTEEACSFRDQYSALKKRVTILGVSADTAEQHRAFADRYSLPFTLLADTQRKTIHDYGADGLLFPKRVSFLINPDGNIAQLYPTVKPSEHAGQILSDLNTLQAVR
ncbi:MAG: peroxiredoxin [Patescibacteria group bacterium]